MAALLRPQLEIDHIVPLELGGSNAIANLFPEPAAAPRVPRQGRLENRANARSAPDTVAGRAARHGFATNWETLYRRRCRATRLDRSG